MANLSEKEVLRVSLVVLRKVFKEWANVERRQSDTRGGNAAVGRATVGT